LEVNQKAANAKRFVDMGLWHRVEQINHIAMKQAKAQETFQVSWLWMIDRVVT
jgi:hypothetical protein